MAVALRLRREGNRNRAYYKIVATDSRARRDGNFIEQIGTYDPHQEGKNFTIDLEKVDKWVGNGAQPSDRVKNIIKHARKEQGAEA
ncbi:30S ribosomal protein S16 [Sulfuriroseicoccus oceanibius]|uniref:Small ribosomal subunit protein bS16 n=1 Tax=Sulfuriroseicoccus oceanibius TaxID=2707525 RepID=A0A6B3LC66_9BACT|nr:30S ribosomal protein S16 [Sulfuriroseicoccus oceanibius]QQL45702.1 30S ribosomal protein S16 [Sulfuriroseicoccus oceanibius]